jgi:hypothetical protein
VHGTREPHGKSGPAATTRAQTISGVRPPLECGSYARRRLAPLRPRFAKGLRPANQRGLIRGMGGKMSGSHPLARRYRRHGQFACPQGSAGRLVASSPASATRSKMTDARSLDPSSCHLLAAIPIGLYGSISAAAARSALNKVAIAPFGHRPPHARRELQRRHPAAGRAGGEGRLNLR